MEASERVEGTRYGGASFVAVLLDKHVLAEHNTRGNTLGPPTTMLARDDLRARDGPKQPRDKELNNTRKVILRESGSSGLGR